jgi:hypothetical protein
MILIIINYNKIIIKGGDINDKLYTVNKNKYNNVMMMQKQQNINVE